VWGRGPPPGNRCRCGSVWGRGPPPGNRCRCGSVWGRGPPRATGAGAGAGERAWAGMQLQHLLQPAAARTPPCPGRRPPRSARPHPPVPPAAPPPPARPARRADDPSRKRLGAFLVNTQFQGSVNSSAMFLTAAAQNLLCMKIAAEMGVALPNAWVTWFKVRAPPGARSFLPFPLWRRPRCLLLDHCFSHGSVPRAEARGCGTDAWDSWFERLPPSCGQAGPLPPWSPPLLPRCAPPTTCPFRTGGGGARAVRPAAHAPHHVQALPAGDQGHPGGTAGTHARTQQCRMRQSSAAQRRAAQQATCPGMRCGFFTRPHCPLRARAPAPPRVLPVYCLCTACALPVDVLCTA
jgi:hypothetical protein